MIYDTHAHFDVFKSSAQVRDVVARAQAAGVNRILAVGGSKASNKAALDAARMFPDVIRVAVGFDRDQARRIGKDNDSRQMVENLARKLGSGDNMRHVAAIGEMGLDFHYSRETKEQQILLFREQLRLANELGLPVSVHSREAEGETMAELEKHAGVWKGSHVRTGVLHCFTGSAAFAQKLLACGYYISFSGIVTFPRADELRELARQVPEERLLIETDTPYLAPMPHRGKRNEPAFARRVLEQLSGIRGLSLERLAAATFDNALRLFG